jgi:hypothetical protein
MSTQSINPLNLRLPPDLGGKADPDVVDAVMDHDQAINDLQQAIPALKSQIDALKPGTSSTSTTENVTNNSETVISAANVIGSVNNQTGVTSYATAQSDYGAFILLSDASPIAVTLTAAPVITLPWYATFINSGTGTATLTPASGTIQGNANFPLYGGQFVTVAFDGTNFEIVPLLALPQAAGAVSHEWIASYNASTGVFSLSQPAIADVSGLAAALALLAPIASPTFTGTVTQPTPSVLTGATTATSATAGTASALPALPVGYLSMSINGTTYKLPFFAV